MTHPTASRTDIDNVCCPTSVSSGENSQSLRNHTFVCWRRYIFTVITREHASLPSQTHVQTYAHCVWREALHSALWYQFRHVPVHSSCWWLKIYDMGEHGTCPGMCIADWNLTAPRLWPEVARWQELKAINVATYLHFMWTIKNRATQQRMLWSIYYLHLKPNKFSTPNCAVPPIRTKQFELLHVWYKNASRSKFITAHKSAGALITFRSGMKKKAASR